MAIHDKDAFMRGLWDWSMLDGCFGGTRITPTDVDGMVERNGHFLVLEGKPYGKDVSRGQQYTFDALQKTGLFTIIVIWGVPPDKPYKLFVMSPKTSKEIYPAGVAELKAVVADWFMYAHRHRRHN